MENNIENNEQQLSSEQQISNEFFQKYKKYIRRAKRVVAAAVDLSVGTLIIGCMISGLYVVPKVFGSMIVGVIGLLNGRTPVDNSLMINMGDILPGVVGVASSLFSIGLFGTINKIFRTRANRNAKKYLERERENINKAYEKVCEKYEQLNLDGVYKEVEEVYKELNEICDSIERIRREREQIINVFNGKKHDGSEYEVELIEHLSKEGYHDLLEKKSKQILEYEGKMEGIYASLSELNNKLNDKLNSVKVLYEDGNKQRDEFRNMIIDSDKECMKKYKDLKQQSETYQNKIEKYEGRYVDVKKEYDKISERYKEIKNVHEISLQDKVKNSSRTKGKERE